MLMVIDMKVIVFDLDNTLIDRQRAFTEMLKDRIELTLPEHKKHLKEQAIQDILMWDDNGTVSRSVSFEYSGVAEPPCPVKIEPPRSLI